MNYKYVNETGEQFELMTFEELLIIEGIDGLQKGKYQNWETTKHSFYHKLRTPQKAPEQSKDVKEGDSTDE